MAKALGFIGRVIGRKIWSAVLAALVLLSSSEVWATHFRYGNVTWKPRPDISASTVEFTVTSSWRRSAFPGGSGGDGYPITGDLFTPVILFFGDGSDVLVEHFVTGYSVAEDWINGVGRDPGTGDFFILHTYPSPDNGGSPWVAELNSCCRISTLVNAADANFRVLTLVESATGNRAPVSSMPPYVTLQEGGVRTFFVPGADPNPNTTLNWRLATLSESEIPYQPGPPGAPNTLFINPFTGQAFWDVTGLTVGSLWACQVVIEDRDATTGSLKTQVAVDFIIRIAAGGANNPPVFDIPPSPACGDTLTVSIGNNLQFLVQASDVDSGATVTLNSPGVPPGASMTPALPTSSNPVSSTFSWSPTTGQEGNYVVTFTATDELGAQALCSYTVVVQPSSCDTARTDVNGDGSISPADYVTLLNFVVLGTGCPFCTGIKGDLNCDGFRDAADLALLQQAIYVGICCPCPPSRATIPDPRDSVIIESRTVVVGAHPGTGSDTAAYLYVKVWITNKDSITSLSLPLEIKTVSGNGFTILSRPRNFNGTITRHTTTLPGGFGPRVNSVSPDSGNWIGLFDAIDPAATIEPPNTSRKLFWEIKFDTVTGCGPVVLDSIRILDNTVQFTGTNCHPRIPVNFVKGTVTVVGGGNYQLTLAPPSSTNQIGTAHTVTATLTNSAVPVQGGSIYFQVIGGPHTGMDGNDVTDVNGEATFTYVGSTVGTDTILATAVSVPSDSCFAPVASNTATKFWTAPPNDFLQFDVPPSVPCGSALSINVGARLRFRVQASNTNTGQIVTLNVASLPVGATMTPPLPTTGNPVASEFSWTPVTGQEGTYTVTYTATGGINSPVTCSYDITVLPKVPCAPLPLAFIAASPAPYVMKFNDLCNLVRQTAPAGGGGDQPTQLEVVFDTIFATDPVNDMVYKLNPRLEPVSTFTDPLLKEPYGIVVQPTDSTMLWITNKFEKTVVKMNKGNGLVTSFPTDTVLPTLLTGIAFNPTNDNLFVAGRISLTPFGRIMEIKPSDGSWVQTITHDSLKGSDFALAFSPGGNLYVSTGTNNAVLEFELSPGVPLVRVIRDSLNDPRGLTFSPTESLFVASKGNQKIVQFDTAGNFVRICSDAGMKPTDVAFQRTTKGDLTEDGLLTPADAVAELNCVYLEIFPSVTSCGCDLNCDNEVKPSDVVLELQAVFLGLPFPCL